MAKQPTHFECIASQDADTVTVNLSFLQRLTDNLNNTSLSKIIDQFKKELDRCENSQEFLTLLEDELIFHKTIEGVESFDRDLVEEEKFDCELAH